MENLIVDDNTSHCLNYESSGAAGAATSSAVFLHIISKSPFFVVLHDDADGAQILPLSVGILLDLRDFQDHQEHFASPLNLRVSKPRVVVLTVYFINPVLVFELFTNLRMCSYARHLGTFRRRASQAFAPCVRSSLKPRDNFGTHVRPERGETGARECRLKVVLEDGQHGGGEPLEHWVRVHAQLYEGWKTTY